MPAPYSLDQYVHDLRTITAKEANPGRITNLVAPFAKKFAKRPDGFVPNIVSATSSKASVSTCCTKSPTTIWPFF